MKVIKQGFSLVELLVVMSIIAILASAGAYLAISANLQRGRDTVRKSDLEYVRGAIEAYRYDQGSYPNIASGSAGWTALGTTLSTGGYLQTMPIEKTSGRYYSYIKLPSGCTTACSNYALCAVMENSANANSYATCTVNTCGASLNCNYGIGAP